MKCGYFKSRKAPRRGPDGLCERLACPNLRRKNGKRGRAAPFFARRLDEQRRILFHNLGFLALKLLEGGVSHPFPHGGFSLLRENILIDTAGKSSASVFHSAASLS